MLKIQEQKEEFSCETTREIQHSPGLEEDIVQCKKHFGEDFACVKTIDGMKFVRLVIPFATSDFKAYCNGMGIESNRTTCPITNNHYQSGQFTNTRQLLCTVSTSKHCSQLHLCNLGSTLSAVQDSKYSRDSDGTRQESIDHASG